MLYGESEPGGIVNVVTKQPLDEPFYAVDQQVGSLAEYRTTLDATGPLTSDKAWLYRINMSYENNGAPFGSFIDNTHAENIFVAPVLKWIWDNDTWVKLEGQYYKNSQSGTFSSTPEFNGGFITIPRSVNYSSAYSPAQNDNIFSALTWQHNFDKDWSIKQLIAFNRYENNSTLRLGTIMDNFSFPFANAGSGFFSYPPFFGPYTSPVYNRSLYASTYSTQTTCDGGQSHRPYQHLGRTNILCSFGGDFYKTLNWNQYLSSPINSPSERFLAGSTRDYRFLGP